MRGSAATAERRDGQDNGQAATYLLHLFQGAVVDARLLKVILRRLDYLLHDLLVHAALVVAVSKPASTLAPDARASTRCATQGILTTTEFDMMATAWYGLSYLVYDLGSVKAGQRRAMVARVQRLEGYGRQAGQATSALEAANRCARSRKLLRGQGRSTDIARPDGRLCTT